MIDIKTPLHFKRADSARNVSPPHPSPTVPIIMWIVHMCAELMSQPWDFFFEKQKHIKNKINNGSVRHTFYNCD